MQRLKPDPSCLLPAPARPLPCHADCRAGISSVKTSPPTKPCQIINLILMKFQSATRRAMALPLAQRGLGAFSVGKEDLTETTPLKSTSSWCWTSKNMTGSLRGLGAAMQSSAGPQGQLAQCYGHWLDAFSKFSSLQPTNAFLVFCRGKDQADAQPQQTEMMFPYTSPKMGFLTF